MEDTAAQVAVASELGFALEENNFAAGKAVLVDKVNQLILSGFEKLVSILYRLDVSEQKINAVLKQNAGEDAAGLIVDLMLERAAAKIKSRQQFSQRDDTIDDEEKW